MAVASVAEVTPRLFLPVPWVADLVATLAVASEAVSVAASREVADVEVSGEAVEVSVAVVASVAAATSVPGLVTADRTDTAHPETPPQDLVAASEVIVVTEATAASPVVGMTVVVAAHMTTDPVAAAAAAAIAMEAALVIGTVTVADVLEATWNPSGLEGKVGIATVVTAETEATERTGTAAETETEITTDLAMTTVENAATRAVVTRIRASCVVTDETPSVLRWVTISSSHLSVSFLLPLLS